MEKQAQSVNVTPSAQKEGHDLHDLHSILQLSKDLRQRDIPVKAVKVAMKLQEAIQDGACTADDLGSALELLPVLHKHGLSPQDDRTETAIQLAARTPAKPALAERDRELAERIQGLSGE